MKEDKQPFTFPLSKENYLIMAAGCVIAVIGYALMSGGGSEDPAQFDPEIFSTRRITIAPWTVMIGYGIILWGIMKKQAPKA